MPAGHLCNKAYANDQNLQEFTRRIGKNLSDKKVMAAVRELYYQNGYRAIKYELDNCGREEALAVYDPSCISITQITASKHASPVTCAVHHGKKQLLAVY